MAGWENYIATKNAQSRPGDTGESQKDRNHQLIALLLQGMMQGRISKADADAKIEAAKIGAASNERQTGMLAKSNMDVEGLRQQQMNYRAEVQKGLALTLAKENSQNDALKNITDIYLRNLAASQGHNQITQQHFNAAMELAMATKAAAVNNAGDALAAGQLQQTVRQQAEMVEKLGQQKLQAVDVAKNMIEPVAQTGADILSHNIVNMSGTYSTPEDFTKGFGGIPELGTNPAVMAVVSQIAKGALGQPMDRADLIKHTVGPEGIGPNLTSALTLTSGETADFLRTQLDSLPEGDLRRPAIVDAFTNMAKFHSQMLTLGPDAVRHITAAKEYEDWRKVTTNVPPGAMVNAKELAKLSVKPHIFSDASRERLKRSFQEMSPGIPTDILDRAMQEVELEEPILRQKMQATIGAESERELGAGISKMYDDFETDLLTQERQRMAGEYSAMQPHYAKLDPDTQDKFNNDYVQRIRDIDRALSTHGKMPNDISMSNPYETVRQAQERAAAGIVAKNKTLETQIETNRQGAMNNAVAASGHAGTVPGQPFVQEQPQPGGFNPNIPAQPMQGQGPVSPMTSPTPLWATEQAAIQRARQQMQQGFQGSYQPPMFTGGKQ